MKTPVEKAKACSALHAQLLRQLEVKSRHGIDAHKIQTIVLVPSGRAYSGRITYSSAVTMKNGDELFFPDVNIRDLLEGTRTVVR